MNLKGGKNVAVGGRHFMICPIILAEPAHLVIEPLVGIDHGGSDRRDGHHHRKR